MTSAIGRRRKVPPLKAVTLQQVQFSGQPRVVWTEPKYTSGDQIVPRRRSRPCYRRLRSYNLCSPPVRAFLPLSHAILRPLLNTIRGRRPLSCSLL